MVDRIRKFGQWIWMNKERMVLLVMLGVLVFQVYQVFYPPPPPQETLLETPRKGVEHLPPEALPPVVPDPPGIALEGQYATIYRNNPFWLHSGGGLGGGDDEETVRRNVKLVDIQSIGDRTRARIRTESTTRWYDVGTKFEQYTLESVNEAEGTAVVFAESLRKRVTIELQ